jgi:hypothetical protein
MREINAYKRGYHLENVGVDGKISIRMDLKVIVGEVVDWIHLAVTGFCLHNNEPSDSIIGGEFLD